MGSRRKKNNAIEASRGDALVDDAEQIRALVSPVRQEIVDTVQALREASAAELAAELDRPTDGLYYHLKALVRARLLKVCGHRGEGRSREAVYSSLNPDRRLRLCYDPSDSENVAAVAATVLSMLRMTGRDFERTFIPDLAVVDGPQRNLWAGRSKGWLDDEELEQVHSHLAQLRRLLEQPRRSSNQRLHNLTFVLTPGAPTRSG
ncbi:MAG: helix-turn-helix domain-containing protein [Myxococcota bacterium]